MAKKEDVLLIPAITWNNSLVKGKRQTCGYWDCDPLLDLEQNRHCRPENGPGEDREEISSLSYKTVFLVTVFVVKILRQKIQVILSDANPPPSQESSIAVPVAVAIPEGPFLPLAILSAHALNVPFSIEGCDFQAYAIIVPIEPGEGSLRIRHMLAETMATMILCLETDGQRLTSIVDSIEGKCNSSTQYVGNDTGLFQANSPTTINFADIVFQAVEEIRAAKSLQHLLKCLANTESLQTGISHCSQIIVDGTETIMSESPSKLNASRISHLAYTSGSTGVPKGSFSSTNALHSYIKAKNMHHDISHQSTVLLASSLSFDPCLSDIIATFDTQATLGLATRTDLSQNLSRVVRSLKISHVLCTPTLWSTMNDSERIIGPRDFPHLRVVALGGEPIPKQIVQTWARRERDGVEGSLCRLCATYGVTEACVYQTIGEITIPPTMVEGESRGQCVGKPFNGMHVLICQENDQEKLVDAEVGEVVLFGFQLDEWSSYLNRQEQNLLKFTRERLTPSGSAIVTEHRQLYYRTGDRGSIEATTGNLSIFCRIGGEEGMVKVNGVRVELGEIEAALIDDAISTETHGDNKQFHLPVILNAAVVAKRTEDATSQNTPTELIAYCVLNHRCCTELGMKELLGEHSGVLCNSRPMLTLLQTRCKERVRAGCTPSAFIVVKMIPMSPTGKRHLAALPSLSQCVLQDCMREETPLVSYGTAGNFLAEQISSNLNLQRCQQTMLTTGASFSMLGGDSLAATRVVRALYAHHHGLQDSRRLGGTYGTIDGAFSAANLVNARNLGEYVDFLDRNGICSSGEGKMVDTPANEAPDEISIADSENEQASSCDSRLFDALMMATSQGHSSLAVQLLKAGANPNLGSHKGRLGKVSGLAKRQIFTSSPLHVASLKGDTPVVVELLAKGAIFTSPDASACFPLHLAASGESASRKQRKSDENNRRLECVKRLVEAGAPLYMKDGNRQTLIHCAARAGNCDIIEYIMPIWKEGRGERDFRGSSLDWRDHWSRTGVHWAVLNGHLDALRTLLKHGCDPAPPSFKESTKLSSIALESPLELCERLYGTEEGTGLEIALILKEAITQKEMHS